MAVPDAIKALAEHWDDTVGDLDEDRLRAIAGAAPPGDSGDAAVRAAARRVADVVAAALPRRHPVHRALTGGTRLAVGDWTGARPDLAAVTALAAGALAEREADARLLAAPMVPWDEVRRRGIGLDADDLIRLAPPSGGDRAPAFQFDDAGAPRPVVLAVNRLLAVRDDPWGVADWWLGGNAWLAGVPADLLGEVDDETLVSAARAETAVG
jgi:hypothetical protein